VNKSVDNQHIRRTQAQRAEVSEQRMFEAAVAIINERGAAATSLSDVGIQAGYSRGLASHRFEKALDQHYKFCLEAPIYVRTLYALWFESINSDSELGDIINAIHQRRFQDVVNWIVHDSSIDENIKREADIIAAQFSASVTGIAYYWLANPNKLHEIEKLHEGLKRTMRHYLAPHK